ncbi:hypothetical protein [Tenacibaculum phage Larrie]|nr:hypothetical protein [Tenacibaculum phage Larrie]
MDVFNYSIIMFVTQLVFIGCRTWNIKSISKGNLIGALVSGAIVHITWLISISIGSVSMYEIIGNFQIKYLPIIVFSLLGGLIGIYLGFIEKAGNRKKNKKCKKYRKYVPNRPSD